MGVPCVLSMEARSNEGNDVDSNDHRKDARQPFSESAVGERKHMGRWRDRRLWHFVDSVDEVHRKEYPLSRFCEDYIC